MGRRLPVEALRLQGGHLLFGFCSSPRESGELGEHHRKTTAYGIGALPGLCTY